VCCDPSTATNLADRLEQRGLVERRSAPGDRRVRTIALTERGAALRTQLERRMAALPQPLAGLPARQRRELAGALAAALDPEAQPSQRSTRSPRTARRRASS
jgi:DNA-binding MarR family transcriptional regulator